MSEQEFESYLRLLGRLLRLSDEQREAIRHELEDHMAERLAELLERGYTRDEAVATALDEFGDAAALASDSPAVEPPPRRAGRECAAGGARRAART